MSVVSDDLKATSHHKENKRGAMTPGRVGHSLKEWMDSGTVFPGFLCVVSPKSIPSRASVKTPPAEDGVSREEKHEWPWTQL